MPQRAAQLPKTIIDYDRALLNDNERQVVAKLIEASKSSTRSTGARCRGQPGDSRPLAAQAAASPLDQAGYDYFVVNKGRWDRLKEDEPFIAPSAHRARSRKARPSIRPT